MVEETLLDNGGVGQNPTGDMNDFETVARSWLSTLPANKLLNPSDVETWLQSNGSLPDHIKSMPPSDVYQMITSFSTVHLRLIVEKDPFHFRFQRSDQWMPVYKWLETLETDEVLVILVLLD
ncbi:uncharacterized protein LOC143563092 [Bidens hawaiensis]|uniref:uncharacterized protein LOC143563092 n=1 Tax=Bidens hawaiensis TaxID=980011 RepID=UPI0040490A12